jgi:uncharacterized protein YydD (DUF2326 family)
MPANVIEKARADSFFIFFSMLGSDRSLEKLHSYVTKMGLKISLTSLKRYSAKYGWQEKLQEVNEQAHEIALTENKVDKVEMNLRQARAGEALQALGEKGVRVLNGKVQDISFSDVGSLIEKGVKVERLAVGEATERKEIARYAYTVMARQIADIFKHVAERYEMPQSAINEFAAAANQLIAEAIEVDSRELAV